MLVGRRSETKVHKLKRSSDMNLLWRKIQRLRKKAKKSRLIGNLVSKNRRPLDSKDKGNNGIPFSTSLTALQRVDRARENLSSNDTSLVATDESNPIIVWNSDHGHQVLVDRSVSESLLQVYEGGIGSTKKGNTLNYSARRANMKQKSSTSSWKLEKPDKSDILLNFSLTNANGEVWERQRPIIQKAFAASIVRRFTTSAARKSLHEYLRKQGDLQQESQHPKSPSLVATMPTPIKLDARHLSWNIALDTMAVAVVSSKYASRLRGPLEPLYGPSLITNRNKKSERHVLKRVVTSILQDMMLARKSHGIKTKSNHPCCLAESLLVYYKDDSNVHNTSSKETHDVASVEENDNSSSDDDEGGKCATAKEQYLTFDEVVCNCHSALLAGIQSIATILTGALAHLAEHHEYQEQCRIEAFTKTSKTFAKSIVNETMRILPPVATLPRTFKCPSHQQECPRKKAGITIESTSLATDKIIQIDILAMAHSNSCSKSSSIDPQFSSWNFCPSGGVSISKSGRPSPKPSIDPMVSKRSNGNTPRAAPWGLGSRSCPAGMIAVEVIAEVLQEFTRSTYTWSFWDPTESVASPTGRNGWVSHVSYRPTLCYPLPLYLKMVPNNSMVAIH